MATPMLTMTYDTESRLVSATHSVNGTDNYGYDPSNRRVWKQKRTGRNWLTLTAWTGRCWGSSAPAVVLGLDFYGDRTVSQPDVALGLNDRQLKEYLAEFGFMPAKYGSGDITA